MKSLVSTQRATPSQVWRGALPSVMALPEDVWTTRHRLVRRAVWIQAVLLPIYASLLGRSAWASAASGVFLAALAHGSGMVRDRRLASLLGATGLFVPAMLFGELTTALREAVSFHWLVSLLLAWMYREPLVFPLAMVFGLVGPFVHSDWNAGLAQAATGLVVGAISIGSWFQYELEAIRHSIAAPEGVEALATEFRKASEEVGLREPRARLVLSLAVLRMLKKV